MKLKDRSNSGNGADIARITEFFIKSPMNKALASSQGCGEQRYIVADVRQDRFRWAPETMEAGQSKEQELSLYRLECKVWQRGNIS